MAGLCAGVVGLGLGRHHVAAYAEAEDVARLVICDSDAGRLEAMREKFPQVAAAYADLGEMLQAESPDAVSVITPDHLHREHAEACLAAGAHVLVTKPLATTLDDGRAMVLAAEAAGRKLHVAHERRFHCRYLRMKEIIDSGELGEIIHASIETIHDKRRQFTERPWYASAEAGRTAIVGTGIHQVDLMRFLVGRPVESVSAVGSRRGTLAFPADKTTAAVFRFEGRTTGQVTVTLEAHWPPVGRFPDPFWLVGTKGMIFGDQVAIDGRDDWEQLPKNVRPNVAHYRCVEYFLRAILAGGDEGVTAREGFASLAACIAADESAAAGQGVAPAPGDFA